MATAQTDAPRRGRPPVTNEQRERVIAMEASGLVTLIRNAESDADWLEIGRRAGAIQRRARQRGGLSKGG